MSYMTLLAACLGCGKMFASNPRLVPSLKNRPVCRECIERVNPMRIEKGLPPISYHPDAYEPEEQYGD